MVGVVSADLIAGFFECILYGIFFVLSTTSMALLVQRHRAAYGRSSNARSGTFLAWAAAAWRLRRSPLLLATGLLMLTLTAHSALTAHRLILAITLHEELSQAAAFISDLGEMTQVVRLVLLFIDMFIGDLVITYRVWLVWERKKWVVVLPLMTTVALVVTGVGLIRQFIVSQPSGSIFAPQVGRWITAYCVMTFCTNIYGTVVIAYRIWVSNRLLKSSGLSDGGRSLMEAMAIFVESAALYTTWGIFFVVVYGTRSHLQIIGTGCAPAVLGVTFMLITVRVGLGFGQESRAGSTTIQWAAPPRSQESHPPRVEHSWPLQFRTVPQDTTGLYTAEADMRSSNAQDTMEKTSTGNTFPSPV